MNAHSIHELRHDAHNAVWDNSIEPALEVEPGDVVELHARDASDEQIRRDSRRSDVAKIDFAHVNPVSGPVFVKGARPGDTLAVELLELRPRAWGWTAIIPGFGLLADEFPDPWLRISAIDPDARRRCTSATASSLPLPPVLRATIGVAPAEPGAHPILPPRAGAATSTSNTSRPGTTLLSAGRRRGRAVLARRHPRRAGRRRGLRHGDRERDGRRGPAQVRRDITLQRTAVRPAGRRHPREPAGYHVCTGVGPGSRWRPRATPCARRSPSSSSARASTARRPTRWRASPCDLRIHEVVDAPNWVVGAFLPNAIFAGA